MFARSAPRPSLARLGWRALAEPLQDGDVLELAGPACAGKTQLLLEALIRCVLPLRCGGGHGAGALYITTDQSWPQTVVAARLRRRLGAARLTPLKATEALNDCLSRLHIVRCHSPAELLGAVARLHGHMAAHPGAIRLVVLDSLSAYYWQERSAAGASIALARTPTEAAASQEGKEAVAPRPRMTLPISAFAAALNELRRVVEEMRVIVLAARSSGGDAAGSGTTSSTAIRPDDVGQGTSSGNHVSGGRRFVSREWSAMVTRYACVSRAPASAVPLGMWGGAVFRDEGRRGGAGGTLMGGGADAPYAYGEDGVQFF